MRSIVRFARHHRLTAATALALSLALAVPLALAAAGLIQISSDPFKNKSSQHRTQVEPDTFAFGSTIVAAFQSGRFFYQGASDIGYATSADGGTTWIDGSLNCITVYRFINCGSLTPYDRVSDASVAYDAADNVWLISSLPILAARGAGVLVSRSTNGGLTFSQPITVHASGDFHDKDWIVCDNTSTSPYYGHCYVEWDNASLGDLIEMSTSTDGGLTWSPESITADIAGGIGGQPLVQPNGTVIVPIDNGFADSVLAFRSTNGGVSWSSTVPVSSITDHTVTGLRTSPLPSAEIDGAGKVYVVWQDCRFRAGCASNDIVMSTSLDGTTWTAVTRIPIDAVTSTADHFIPGLAVDPNTSGRGAHLGLTFYSYPVASCSISTCRLRVGYISSTDGGATWSKPILLAGKMQLTWLANTSQGRMVGDYISTSFSGGKAIPGFVIAHEPSGGLFDEALYSVQGGLIFLPSQRGVTAAGEQPVPNAASDHPRPAKPINLEQPH